MLKKGVIFFILLMFGSMSFVIAQEPKFIDTHMTNKALKCIACHGCTYPSREDPCLDLGPNFYLRKGKLKPSQLPADLIVINDIDELYGPVDFKHKTHLHMANRVEDCVECHHFIPPGKEKKKCKECHSSEVVRKRLDIMSLTGVFHRQCLKCHVEWGGTSNCEYCHASKKKEVHEKLVKLIPKLRKAERPEVKVFVNRMFTGPFVTFPHKFHAENKKIVCADCHVKEPCIACHYQKERPASISPLARTGVHGTCRLCHDVQSKGSCVKCHKVSDKLYEQLAKNK